MKILLLLAFATCGWCSDFDCLFVGSSPFSLLEAIYQSQMGKKVIVIDSAAECGGAWRTISVCGISQVDLGCHEIGSNQELESFLTDCIGCRLVALNDPLKQFSNLQEHPDGFYFSKGCSELMGCLKQLLAKTNITLLLNTRVEEVSIEDDLAVVKTTQGPVTAEQIFITPMSAFSIQENQNFFPIDKLNKQSFYHFYLLVEDPSEPRFSYIELASPTAYRVMNLTHFSGLQNSGQHLMIVQTRSENANGADLLQEIKQQGLVHEDATLLSEEFYVYERYNSIAEIIEQLSEGRKFFHMLETTRFENLAESVARWKALL